MAGSILTLEERFMQYVEPEPNSGCWLWTGATENGYGYFFGPKSQRRGRMVKAHRLSYEMFVGRIPSGVCVLHKCDVRSCVRPEHLFLGSRSENLRDMAMKGRGSASKMGLPYGVRMTPKGRFVANVWIPGGKMKHLGTFDSADEARQVSVEFKRSYYSCDRPN